LKIYSLDDRLQMCRGESCIRPDRKIGSAPYALSRFKLAAPSKGLEDIRLFPVAIPVWTRNPKCFSFRSTSNPAKLQDIVQSKGSVSYVPPVFSRLIKLYLNKN